jgi:2-keto-4-pentenoate hydratase
MGHPSALDWLQHDIAAQREKARPGDVVITGGVTTAVPVERGDVVEAMLGNSSVTVRLHRLRAR